MTYTTNMMIAHLYRAPSIIILKNILQLSWQYSPEVLFGMVIQSFLYVTLHFKTLSKIVICITFSAAESGKYSG
jgi:hypothetical protein